MKDTNGDMWSVGNGPDESDRAVQEVAELPGPVVVARVAVATIRLPDDSESLFVGPEARELSAEVEEKFRAALEKDARVSELYSRQEVFDIDNARTRPFFRFDVDKTDLLESIDSFQGLCLNSTLFFRVRVPLKNQPLYRSMDDVPTEDYLVAWDGLALAAQWEQPTTLASGSGGHVVLEVLEQAGRDAGYPIEVIACAPSCLHRFVHADFVTFDDEPPPHFVIVGESPVGSSVVTPFVRDTDDRKNLLRLLRGVGPQIHAYAELKSHSHLILHLAERARVDSASILLYGYQRASRRRFPHVVGWAADLWTMRGARRETRRLISGVWLALAMIEAHTGPFLRDNSHYEADLHFRKLEAIKSLIDVDAEEVAGADLSGVRASLEETANRLEGRLLVAATFAGALAAMAGAALAALFT